jgi:hypothetical protein
MKKYFAVMRQRPREGSAGVWQSFRRLGRNALSLSEHEGIRRESGLVRALPVVAADDSGGGHLIAGGVLANVFSLAASVLFYHVTARRFWRSCFTRDSPTRSAASKPSQQLVHRHPVADSGGEIGVSYLRSARAGGCPDSRVKLWSTAVGDIKGLIRLKNGFGGRKHTLGCAGSKSTVSRQRHGC